MQFYFKIISGILLALTASISMAQKDQGAVTGKIYFAEVRDVAGRYPSGSIKSNEQANEAVQSVVKVRAQIEKHHQTEQQACYQKFFATACLDAAAEKRRHDLALLRKIELQANAWMRHARVAERDKRLEEAKAERESRDVQRLNVPLPSKDALAHVEDEQGEQEKDRMLRAEKQAEKNAQRLKREYERLQTAEEEAKKRAQNVQRHEEKVRASHERQEEVARRKAERAQKAAQK